MEEQLAKFSPGPEPLVQTTVIRRRLRMNLLLKQEVDRLVSGYSSPSLGLLGMFFGAFGSLLITVLTAGIAEPMKRYFVDGAEITGIATIVFLLFAANDWKQARKIIADLEKEKGVDFDVALQTKPTAIEPKD
jgi:hypothetical protein